MFFFINLSYSAKNTFSQMCSQKSKPFKFFFVPIFFFHKEKVPMSHLMPFTQFESGKVVQATNADFIDALSKLKDRCEKCLALRTLLSTEKTLKLHIYAEVPAAGAAVDGAAAPWHRLVMIHGVSDLKLVQLGASPTSFPRGFPVVWERDELGLDHFRFFGFREKFENAGSSAGPSDNVDRDPIVSLKASKKYSGSLGLVLCYRTTRDNRRHLVATAKNSLGKNSEGVVNPFALAVEGAWARWFRSRSKECLAKLLDDMERGMLCLCGEVLIPEDPHGTFASSLSWVVTAVGVGSSSDAPDKSRKRFVDFLSDEELVRFAHEHSLPIDGRVEVRGAENCRLFVADLKRDRDRMTNSMLDSIIEARAAEGVVTVRAGTVEHKDLLGDVLEGLVYTATRASGETVTEKFKFCNYTMRTFGMREAIHKYGHATPLGFEQLAHFRAYASRWTVTPEGAQRAIRILCAAWQRLPAEVEAAERERAAGRSSSPYPLSSQEVIRLGLHIKAVEAVNRVVSESGIDALPPVSYEDHSHSEAHIVLVLGPIGYGKSTLAERIAEEANRAAGRTVAEHIDADYLGLGDQATVLRLGPERNELTHARVWQTLARGLTPVVSCGGGQWFGGKYDKRQFSLLERHREFFGPTGLRITVVVAANSPEADLEAIYLDREADKRVEDVVRYRVESGIWALTSGRSIGQLVADVQERSRGNSAIAAECAAFANTVLRYSRATAQEVAREAAEVVLAHPVPPPSDKTSVAISQRRLLVDITGLPGGEPKIGHVTVCHGEGVLSASEVAAEACVKPGETFKGLLITGTPVGPVGSSQEAGPSSGLAQKSRKPQKPQKGVFEFVLVQDGRNHPLLSDMTSPNPPHVTIRPGDEKPAQMGIAALAWVDGKREVTLETGKSYLLTNSGSVEVHVLAKFSF
jgi:hypothetical protein